MLRFSRQICRIPVHRLLSSAAPNTQAGGSSRKEAMILLRKKTGYSYSNVRKAVDKFGLDKMDEAEKWLRELAKKEGWAKAEKLGARVTSQGLVGVVTAGNKAAVIELNCETDFVSRGDVFKQLLAELTQGVLDAGSQLSVPSGAGFTTTSISVDSVQTGQKRSLKEAIAMVVGQLGENITVTRADVIVAPESVQLFARSHPKEDTGSVQAGRFVSLVGLQRPNPASNFPTDRLADQLCQHVIGMQPTSLGAPPAPEQVKATETAKTPAGEQDELNDFYSGATTNIDEDETQLLRQSFMLNPSQTVHSYLAGHGANVVDFVRIELGSGKTA